MLKNLQSLCAVVYIDDINIFSPSLGQHLIDLGKVLKLANVNLKTNLDNYNFVKSEVKAAGHLVSKQGTCPDPKKVKAIQKLMALTDFTGIKIILVFLIISINLFHTVLVWLSHYFAWHVAGRNLKLNSPRVRINRQALKLWKNTSCWRQFEISGSQEKVLHQDGCI